MVVLLHGDNPGDVVESHRTQTEVGVVGDLAHFIDEQVEGGSRGVIDSSDEVGRCQTIVVSRRATAL
jgi:hypothetical protein